MEAAGVAKPDLQTLRGVKKGIGHLWVHMSGSSLGAVQSLVLSPVDSVLFLTSWIVQIIVCLHNGTVKKLHAMVPEAR